MPEIRADHPFSLTRGGPFYHLLRRCRLIGTGGRIRWPYLVLIAWVPVLIAALGKRVLGGEPDAILYDPATHVRFLIGLPLLLLAEHLLEVRSRSAMHHLRVEAIAERTSLDSILSRVEHLRDSVFVEGAFAVIVFAVGQATWWTLPGYGGFLRGLDHGVHSPASFWYLMFALPLVQFLTLRWVWRWMLWTYVLARLARLPLALNAIHPDHAGGLRLLGGPIDAFAMFVSAIAWVSSAAWTTRVYLHRATLESVSTEFLALVLLAMIVACAPLLLFSGKLYRARHRDEERYHELAHEYVSEFRRRWMTERAKSDDVVGTPDIQSLNDLIGSYHSTEATRLYPFEVRAIAYLWLGAFAPMLPLLLTVMPLKEVTTHLGKMLFGLHG